MKLLHVDTLRVTGQKKGIIIRFWETACLTLPQANITTYFSFEAN